jgi:hypothetical protein
MEQWELDYYTYQIISGVIFCDVDGKTYSYKNPSIEHKCFAQKVYKDIFTQCKKEKIWDEDELMTYLLISGGWSSAEEEKLSKMVKNVTDLKIKLYELKLQSIEREMVRRGLNDTRAAIDTLYQKKHELDYLTCHGIASSAKLRYLTGASIYYKSKPYWKDFSGWGKPDYLLDAIINEVNKCRLDEKKIREIARGEPWKSYWGSAKNSGKGVFGKPSIDLTDYQKNLILYAQMYDNIAESPDYPGDDVVKDDDMLDGWMLIQHKQREIEHNKGDIMSSIRNEKIKNSEEVFIKVDTVEDAKKIYEANDFAGKVALAQRMKQIKEEGTVNELDLKETRMRIAMQANINLSNSLK